MFLSLVFACDRVCQLPDLDFLHVDSVLQLQGLLLEEEVGVACIVKLLSQEQDLLLENRCTVVIGNGGRGDLGHVVIQIAHSFASSLHGRDILFTEHALILPMQSSGIRSV